MKKVLPYLLLFIFMNLPGIFAQHARFSQYFNKPLLLNPSLAGNGIEFIRVTAIYRSQWAGMGTPFTTQGLSIDKVVNRIGIGAAIMRNGGGEGSIKTLNLVGNLAYHLPLGYEKNHTLSAGLQIGIVNKSFDPSKLTFDNQYNPDQGYDPSQSSGEIFTTTSLTRPDVNAGFFWQRGWLNKKIKFKPFAGISFSHLTRPNETFIVEESRVNIKRTIYGGAGFMINKQTELKPTVMQLSQGNFNETTFGTLINFQLDNKNQFQLGAYHRINDAVITYAGYQMNQLFVGMSYDINTGELSKTGKGTNAFEISLTYSPRPKKKKVVKEVKPEQPKKKITNTTVKRVKATVLSNDVTMEVVERKTTEPVIPQQKVITEKPVTIPETPKAVIATPITVTIPAIKPAAIKTSESSKEAIKPAQILKETPGVKIPNETVTAVPMLRKTVPVKTNSENESVKPAPKLNENNHIVIPNETIEIIPVIKSIVPIKTESVKVTVKPTEVLPQAPKVIIEVPEPVTEAKVTDSDKDGIADTEDRCPYIKGTKTSAGCPDSDSDGLIDMEDDCPMESGPATNKGCPDPNVPAPKNNQELVKTFDHILFTSGSVKMTTNDIYDIVERAVDILYADKTTMVLLSGHTDAEGDATFNMNLSQARTEVVKAYLLKQGIPESRIQTVAYGETMPVRDNLFDTNMIQNRRVELNILRRK